MDKTLSFFKSHYLAVILAIFVGLITILPLFLAKWSLGPDYQGVPFICSANEDVYLAKMQELAEGHWFSNSAYFYEYKKTPAVVPFFGEFIYSLPTIVFRISVISTDILNKFLFPAILFLLVYWLILKLINSAPQVGPKINAIAGALFITLGYDLIDLKNAWLMLSGQDVSTKILMWARPVNPISGAILMFLFFLLIWSIINYSKSYLSIIAGIVLGLMFGYIFSWSLSLMLCVSLAVVFLFKKNYKIFWRLLTVLFINFLITMPYLMNAWRLIMAKGDSALSTRNGMMFTHAPMVNKVILLLTIIFILSSLFAYYKKIKINENWWWFCLSLLISGWVCFNQQIITGRTIWPYHFVQYTIPISIVVGLVLFFRFIRPYYFYVYFAAINIIILASLIFSFQASASYKYDLAEFRRMQPYQPIFNYLNKQTEIDSVVLVREPTDDLTRLIPAFTHDNVYVAPGGYDLEAPSERRNYNFLVKLKINGVKPEQLNDYLTKNNGLVRAFYFQNWQEVFSTEIDPWFEALAKDIRQQYDQFYNKDFYQELKKYRLDYILSTGPLEIALLNELKNPRMTFQSNGFYFYNFE